MQNSQGPPSAAGVMDSAQQQQPQHQQWMAMQAMQHGQYPAAAMVMQHQMMPPPQPHPAAYTSSYAPQPYMYPPQMQPQQQQIQAAVGQGSGGGGVGVGGEENKTVWVGDLQYWMDENYLNSCFVHTGEVMSIKVIRNKQSGQSEGYGFVEFVSKAAAEKIIQSYNGAQMPNSEQNFRLNWATFSMGDKRPDPGSDHSIFVGDLASDVTDSLLQETFASRYQSVKGAKVVIDANTGRSKGYGFVRFGDENERIRAMSEMNGVYCSSRPMRIGAATPRKSSGFQQQYGQGQSFQSEGDASNTTIFVGGLDPSVSDEDLRQTFAQFGEITSVKIPVGKGCGFVQFVNRSNAEEALQKLTGTVLGKQTIRLSWGRNPANKMSRVDQGNQWNGSYYGGPVYDGGYGYAPAAQDPSVYGGYGAYPIYGQQQVS